jgi:hypothetical protein
MYLLFPSSMRDLEIIGEARRQEDGGLAKIDIRVGLSNGPVACKDAKPWGASRPTPA